MILGEHAVLHGHPAIVSAVSQRISVLVTTYKAGRALIHSAIAEREMALDAINVSAPLDFIGTVIQEYAGQLEAGLEMTITADMPPDIGFGSSAAVTVAGIAAIQAMLGHALSPTELHERCLACIRQVQGRGSGADVAASVYGGMLLYQADPVSVDILKESAPLTVAWSGSKEKTQDVVAHVEALREQQTGLVDALYSVAGDLSRQAADAIRERDWELLGECTNAGQEIMKAIGVSNEHLDSIVQEMREAPDIHGAKISGAGLGDCIIGIGNVNGADCPLELIPTRVGRLGVQIEQESATP